ncbi:MULTISPECIES: thiolase family protein [Thermoactinomyces]|jgi:acetyl-CoA acyltransferase|uniref:Thiolase family protein n=1 Tax=Thermoactinomyces daqus TaxID=1329516 RepID=A0A7W1XBK9_9BACL|nr:MULTISPECIES: thiolase family protein [Thermoactinomyces]MBA4543562.1 thiolase family protein [Thermoactinomyces daqus]MBH8596577.1 thiolase family protein [Thermoactinomyces sp. CICC 10523]MBH8603339.1 thiolase family protein [Thermoactinomyces sp. CICC 10522]MBH8607894.1 thiolase family protein [Thermoactinomyces sp. CICC 10521]
MNEQDAVIIDAARTPIGRKKGSLSGIRPDELAAFLLQKLVERNQLDPAEIEDIKMGCVTQTGEQGYNIGRLAGLIAGFPVEVCGVSVNRMCASSLETLAQGAHAIMAGMSDCVIAAGVESMNRVPMGSDGGSFSDQLLNRFNIVPQGISAELIAEKWQLSREELDQFSLSSHQKALKAQSENRFQNEIIPVKAQTPSGETIQLQTDETPRPDTNLEALLSLPPSFLPDGKITAGNSSQISDGVAAVLLASRRKAEELGLKPRAKVRATAIAGVDPEIMLTGIIPATQKVLKRAGLTLDDIDLFEVNEAFASVVLAWQRELGVPSHKINPNGGAIALGHPLGASGARIVATLLNELERQEKRFGLIAMCIGFGMASAIIIEREGE